MPSATPPGQALAASVAAPCCPCPRGEGCCWPHPGSHLPSPTHLLCAGSIYRAEGDGGRVGRPCSTEMTVGKRRMRPASSRPCEVEGWRQ